MDALKHRKQNWYRHNIWKLGDKHTALPKKQCIQAMWISVELYLEGNCPLRFIVGMY